MVRLNTYTPNTPKMTFYAHPFREVGSSIQSQRELRWLVNSRYIYKAMDSAFLRVPK